MSYSSCTAAAPTARASSSTRCAKSGAPTLSSPRWKPLSKRNFPSILPTWQCSKARDLVIAQEVGKNRAWDEAKINRLTGGDPITARYMRQDFFTYTPRFKLMIAGNHKPSLRSVNEATRRRFHLIPFTVTIPADKRDQDLPEKLVPEWPGILNWALQGCLEWQRMGLATPQAVRDASEAYFAEEDLISNWIEECCAVDNCYSELSSVLYRSWKKWADERGEYPGSNKAFSKSLDERGFKSKHGMGRGAVSRY